MVSLIAPSYIKRERILCYIQDGFLCPCNCIYASRIAFQLVKGSWHWKKTHPHLLSSHNLRCCHLILRANSVVCSRNVWVRQSHSMNSTQLPLLWIQLFQYLKKQQQQRHLYLHIILNMNWHHHVINPLGYQFIKATLWAQLMLSLPL